MQKVALTKKEISSIRIIGHTCVTDSTDSQNEGAASLRLRRDSEYDHEPEAADTSETAAAASVDIPGRRSGLVTNAVLFRLLIYIYWGCLWFEPSKTQRERYLKKKR